MAFGNFAFSFQIPLPKLVWEWNFGVEKSSFSDSDSQFSVFFFFSTHYITSLWSSLNIFIIFIISIKISIFFQFLSSTEPNMFLILEFTPKNAFLVESRIRNWEMKFGRVTKLSLVGRVLSPWVHLSFLSIWTIKSERMNITRQRWKKNDDRSSQPSSSWREA